MLWPYLRTKTMGKWLDFYIPFFRNLKDAEKFINRCEKQQPPNNLAKILMHQAQRLITLADDIPKLRPHEESLQIFFLVMCAENISKLHDSYDKVGKSRHYVHRFFKTCSFRKGIRKRSHGFDE